MVVFLSHQDREGLFTHQTLFYSESIEGFNDKNECICRCNCRCNITEKCIANTYV